MLILKVGEVVSLENVDGETPTDYRNYPRRVSLSPGLHKQTKKKSGVGSSNAPNTVMADHPL